MPRLSVLVYACLPALCAAAGVSAGLVLTPDHAPAVETAMESGKIAAKAAPRPDAEAIPDAAADPEAETAAAEAEPPELDGRVIHLGRMTIPIRKTRSTSYYVADFGLAMADADLAGSVADYDHTIRFRDVILRALDSHEARTALMQDKVDTAALSDGLRDALAERFEGVDDVLILTLYQTEVPHV